MVHTDVPNLADAAIWVWAGGYFGALYAFKGGTLEVAVKISGIAEGPALEAAKTFAARALGGTSKTGYAYAPEKRETLITAENYNGPGILSPLFLGTAAQIPDDEMTRNYVISLVQTFNKQCPNVPDGFALMDYGFYYGWHANKTTLKEAFKGDLEKGFKSVAETIHRAQPHTLVEAGEDAETFLRLNGKPDQCLTAPVQQLYNHIAELARERGNLPPDAPDDGKFLSLMRTSVRQKYENGFDLPNYPTREEQAQLRRIKAGCLIFTKGAAFSMEGFCRCQADAAKESRLSKTDLDLLATHFTQETLTQLSSRYSVFAERKKACYE